MEKAARGSALVDLMCLVARVTQLLFQSHRDAHADTHTDKQTHTDVSTRLLANYSIHQGKYVHGINKTTVSAIEETLVST